MKGAFTRSGRARTLRALLSPSTRTLTVKLLLIAAVALGAGSCFPLSPGVETNLAGQEIRLTILHTSDIHSRLLPYDFAPLKTDVDLGLIPEAGPFGGVARLGALLKRERASADRVIHLDSGDSFQGAPIFNVNGGTVEYKFLSLMGVDAAAIGNHEFDLGAANFTNQARDNATFPVLAANYFWDDWHSLESNKTALYTQPYTIKNIGGLKVGVIGFGNLGSLNSIVEGGNSLQVTPLEQNEAIRGYVELLKPVVDVILITSHGGLTEDQNLIQGYEAFYEWGKAKQFVARPYASWRVLEWFGPEGVDDSVVRVEIPGVVGIDAILGGHLHIVLNPPQMLVDPAGRQVILSHGGAFAKTLNRLDVVVKMPADPTAASEGGEIISHDFRVFPVDSLWCSDAMHQLYKDKFWDVGEFARNPQVRAAMAECTAKEDPATTQLLAPYIVDLDFKLSLTSLFGYAPIDIARRNNSTGGDSPLGNLAADSMRKRQRVDAELSVTNSLGIRDNLYAGPITFESMFNVFPFENTINIMYLSGVELQEMFDFVAERSSERGCVSQAQVSGVRFTMDCAQVQFNDRRDHCDPANEGRDCPTRPTSGHAPWQCLADELTGGRCWAHPGVDITVNGSAIDRFATYRVATNDYIAKGGSGFAVLKRNTTRIETGIPLRDSLIGYLQNFCNCDDLLAGNTDAKGNAVSKSGAKLCGHLIDGVWQVSRETLAYCRSAQQFQQALEAPLGACSCREVLRGNAEACGVVGTADVVHDLMAQAKAECVNKLSTDGAGSGGPVLGKCQCLEALSNEPVCGHVTSQLRAFCENPMQFSIATGVEDGRIERRVK